MPLSSCSLQRIGVVTANGTFKAAMSSSNFSAWGRNQCPRGFRDRASVGAYQGLSEVDAFGSCYSHVRPWRGSNYGYWQVYNGPFFQARGAPQQQFRLWSSSHPGLPPKSADHRNWIRAASQPPLECERFKVLSYNILADYLALDHQSNLYFHIPNHIMAWEWRKRRLFIEFGLWSPDIMCLQEVDRFCDLEGELAIRGYAGIWKMRTGNAVDGCAIFWRTNRFQLRHEEHIEFSKLGLRDNVAQICVLETKMQYLAENVFTTLPTSYCQSTGANQVIVCNIHVLYNPKRGEIKLGQVRVLLDRAYAVSKDWNNAPVIICGDFNSTPMSPLYKFIATQKLNFSGLDRDQISGQYSATVHRPNYGVSSYRCQSFSRHESEGAFGTHQDVQFKADKQMPFGATAIKLGEAEIFSHQDGGASSAHSKLANLPSITSEISCQQNIIHGNRETDKNSREAFKNILDVSCFEDRKFSPGSSDFASGIKSSSTFGIDNLTSSYLPKNVNFHGIQKDVNYVGKASSFHSNIDDFSTLTSCEDLPSDDITVDKILHVDVADDFLYKKKPSTCESFEMPMVENIENSSTDSAIAEKASPLINLLNSGNGDDLDLFKFDESHVSDRKAVISSVEDEKVMENMNSGGDSKKVSSDKILQDIPTLCDNLSRGATSAENRHSLELPCLEENEDFQSLELSGLEVNEDPNFLKELLGMEDQFQTTKDFNSPSMVHLKDSSFPLSSASSNIERYFCNPYCWSPMEMEIASGKENCTVVEHPLKLRSVYRDVEDYTGTKDSSKEPQVTSYNRQFMGTVDYIWCSEGLLTTTVLDTIPKHVLQRTPGFPTQKWGSDHIALVCELAFSEGSQKR